MTRPNTLPYDDIPAHYRIQIRGRFDQTWSDWFDNLSLSLLYDRGDSITTLYGVIKDQAALHGLLTRVRDLGLILLLVERLDGENKNETGN
jgi:hypothetical protein